MTGRQNGYDLSQFEANVASVEVVCSGQRIFTPGSLHLKRSANHTCRAESKGYEPKTFTIHSRSSKRGFGASTGANFLFGLITLGPGLVLGWVVDWASGAMRNLKPNNFYLEMQKESGGAGSEFLKDTAKVVGKIATVPGEVVKESATAVLDATLHEGAKKMGVVEEAEVPVDESAKEFGAGELKV